MRKSGMHASDMRGFSMIELAIVLTVVGFLIAGAVAGQSLMKAAELRQVTSEFQRYHVAITTFKDIHNSLPGDMPDAYSVWGSSCGTDAAAPGGCNGNGDEFTDYMTEGARFWQHLELEGLIEQAGYTGTFDVNKTGIFGTNMPASSYPNGGYISDMNNTGTDWWQIGNFIRFVAEDATGRPDQPILTPADAEAIDKKMDDGKPQKGRVLGILSGCAASGEYAIGTDSVLCAVTYQLFTHLGNRAVQ